MGVRPRPYRRRVGTPDGQLWVQTEDRKGSVLKNLRSNREFGYPRETLEVCVGAPCVTKHNMVDTVKKKYLIFVELDPTLTCREERL